jgi:hypothetical protein
MEVALVVEPSDAPVEDETPLEEEELEPEVELADPVATVPLEEPGPEVTTAGLPMQLVSVPAEILMGSV